MELSVINYPKFQLPLQELKHEVEQFTTYLMDKFQQNRILIEYMDETVMFEKSENLDPAADRYIRKKN